MRYLQFLDFELGTGCNLSKLHTACPANKPSVRFEHLDATKAMTDDQILAVAKAAYTKHGFHGYVGWHYYNEPLLYAKRMWPLMEKLKAKVPKARFVLWTNGELLPENLEDLKAFSQIWISNYFHKDFSAVQALVPRTHILGGDLDTRLVMPRMYHTAPCLRPYVELIFDYYGNAHICCMDWKGKASPGNIHKQPLEAIVAEMQRIRRTVSGTIMTADAPAVCKTCELRFGALAYTLDEAIAREQEVDRAKNIATAQQS
jgi:hypothetical protein